MTSAADLRPQTIGELLDRGVRVYVSAFVRFFVPLAFVALTFLTFDMVVDPQPPGGIFAGLAASLHPRQPWETAPRRAVPIGTRFLKGAANVLEAALEVNIAAILMNGLLAGAVPNLGAAIRRGCSRALITTGVTLLYGLVAIPIALGIVIVIAIPAFVVSQFMPFSPTIGWLMIVAGFACAIVPVALIQLAWYQSAIAVTAESEGVLAAFDAGWRHTFFRGGIRRSLAAGFTLLAIGIGAALSGDALGSLIGSIPGLALAGNVPPSIAAIVATGLETVFVAFYGRDVRARRGRLDFA